MTLGAARKDSARKKDSAMALPIRRSFAIAVALGVVVLTATMTGAPAGATLTPVGTVSEFFAGITPDSDPFGIAAGPDGDMWFTQYDSNQVGRITMTGLVHEFSAGITANSVPTWIAEGPDGSLWFAQQIGERVARITTGVPSPPRAVRAGPRNRAAVVTWTAPVSDGATAISGYRVTATPGEDHVRRPAC